MIDKVKTDERDRTLVVTRATATSLAPSRTVPVTSRWSWSLPSAPRTLADEENIFSYSTPPLPAPSGATSLNDSLATATPVQSNRRLFREAGSHMGVTTHQPRPSSGGWFPNGVVTHQPRRRSGRRFWVTTPSRGPWSHD